MMESTFLFEKLTPQNAALLPINHQVGFLAAQQQQ